MEILKKLVFFVATIILSYLLSPFFGNYYEKLFPSPGSIVGVVDLRGLVGIPLAYIFFLTLLFTSFGGEKKYWWMGVLLIPVAIFELYFYSAHIYFPIALGLAGWLIGFLLAKLIANFAK